MSTHNICFSREIRKLSVLFGSIKCLIWSYLIVPMLSDQSSLGALFVCVEILRPSQPKGFMMCAVSLPNLLLMGRLNPLSG